MKRANSNSQAAIWRRKTAKELFVGNATPFLALVGVTLASGTGIVTKQDELECVCKEIQQSARKTLNSNDQDEQFVCHVDDSCTNKETEDQKHASNIAGYSWSLKDFELGSVIAKGCNAVVYASRIKESVMKRFIKQQNHLNPQPAEQDTSNREANLVDVHLHNDKFIMDEQFTMPATATNDASISKAPVISGKKYSLSDKEVQYPLAIKMMFNYDIESNAHVIFRAMYREIVVARNSIIPDEVAEWTKGLHSRKKTLPPHPNIIEMQLAFTDFIPNLSNAMELYPDALPQRLNPHGVGRNMSLFLVMKRYDYTLRDFLQTFSQDCDIFALSWKTSLVLLTQLLEGISHMVEHKIAHRDLKSDNILISVDSSSYDSVGVDERVKSSFQFPHLVISDFGCCLADSKLGLKLPYSSLDTDRGGNVALMAPEVLYAEPGMFNSINYSKSDVWSAGAIAYELFGAPNPFYDDQKFNTRGNVAKLKTR